MCRFDKISLAPNVVFILARFCGGFIERNSDHLFRMNVTVHNKRVLQSPCSPLSGRPETTESVRLQLTRPFAHHDRSVRYWRVILSDQFPVYGQTQCVCLRRAPAINPLSFARPRPLCTWRYPRLSAVSFHGEHDYTRLWHVNSSSVHHWDPPFSYSDQ